MGSSGGGAAAAAATRRMDTEAATELARKGVTLLFLDVPHHTVLGVDAQVFSVGPRFRGIKMVPPGPHFLHYCSTAGTGMSSRLQSGSFYYSPISGGRSKMACSRGEGTDAITS